MVQSKLFSKLRMFWLKLCKSTWNCAWNLAFPVFISPIVWNMCENLHYESVYFKELHNEQEYYWPTIYRVGAAVVTTITSEVCVFFKVGVSAKETETQIVAREFEANIVGKYRVESKPTRCAMRWNRTGSVDTTLLEFWLASRESYSVYFSLCRLG